MAFFKARRTADALREQGEGGNYINKSGIYPVTINFVSVQVNDKNARSLVFNVDYKGTTNILYGLTLDNNDGSENFKMNIFNKLVIIAGLEVVSDPVIETRKVGKNQIEKEFSVLTDFSGLEVQIRVQEEYSIWNNELSEKLEIRGFYRADGATAGEIEAGEGFGNKRKKDEEFKDAVTYKDNLTAEKVAEMKKAKALKAKKSNTASTMPPPAENLFGS